MASGIEKSYCGRIGKRYTYRIPSETQRITNNIPVITLGDIGVVMTPSDLLASSSHNIYQSTKTFER